MIKESFDLIQFKFNIYKLKENNTKYRNHKVPKYKKATTVVTEPGLLIWYQFFINHVHFLLLDWVLQRKLHAAKDGYFTGQIPSQNTAKPEITGDLN